MKHRRPPLTNKWLMFVGAAAAAAFVFFVINLFSGWPSWRPLQYIGSGSAGSGAANTRLSAPEPVFRVTHLPPPEPVKAIYLTSWVAGSAARRDDLINLLAETELNAVVIDIKDYSGRIAFAVPPGVAPAAGAVEERIRDIKEFIGALHAKGIYVIGRLSVFQDVFLAEARPELAVRRASDGLIWRDRKGLPWLEPAAVEVWDYIARLARAAYGVGFDELNFDYIRFPSDGDMRDLSYRFFDSRTETRAAVLKRFFAYLDNQLSDLGAPLSADLFGLTTTAFDDLGIGQVLVEAAPYFDYLAPMVYPSHFASGFLNFSNPAEHPYEVVKHSLSSAANRLNATSSNASTTPSSPASTTPRVKDAQPSGLLVRRGELRPWLQDFDLGADYTAEMVRAQIQATYDSGLTSWMLWDPSNRYTREALDK